MSAASTVFGGGRSLASRHGVLVALSIMWIGCAVYLFVRSSALFFSSLSLVAILVVVALGLTIIFGIMKIANFAHGEFVMIGAFTAWAVTQNFGGRSSFYLALPIAFVVAALLGLLMESSVLRWTYGKGLIAPMLATWAVSIILRELVRLRLGAGFKRVAPPLVDAWHVGGLTIPSYRAFTILIAVVVVIGMMLLYSRTLFGLKSRATAEDSEMAEALGINVRNVYRWSIALGSGLAGLSGALIAPLVAIAPFMGVSWLVKAFFVVIIGGPASIAGTVVGGNAMGWPDRFMATYFPTHGALYGQIAVIVLAGVVIMLKPRGVLESQSAGRGDE